MFNSPATASRILPNNKVYRQLFDAQAQLSDVYSRVRNNQLSQSVNIIPPPDSVPLVRNIRPHDTQKRQWMASLPYSNDPNINPITILFHDERKRYQNEQQQELDELKREVFNLPDNPEYFETDDNTNSATKGNLTERITSKRQSQFDELWTEFLNKISDINHNLLIELEKITRQCNQYYEQGDKEIDKYLEKLFSEKDITLLTIKSFNHGFKQLDKLLSPRLLKIQEYCQSIEELELERIHKIRDLFKDYSKRLYQTHHLSDKETALQLEKQANELNTQILDNRRIYAELEARLLAGETVRAHRYQRKLVNHQSKWSDASWILLKQTWIAKLSQCRAKLEPTILSTCEPIGSDISAQTHLFISHINQLNSFVPPKSTRENAQKWYNQGYDIVDTIVHKRQELVRKINEVITNEIDFLNREADKTQDEVIHGHIYDEEQTQMVFERDIIPLIEERKQFLRESIGDRMEDVYEKLTHAMYDVLERLFAFIEPLVEQWDNHQVRLEHVTEKLLEMMQECRRPHDLEHEKKLAKLDVTLDEMRSSSNGTALAAFLKSAHTQLDRIKATYATFYDREHAVVNQYSNMIAGEVNRYRNEMLDYFQARQIDPNADDEQESSSVQNQYYTTSLARKTYEIRPHTKKKSDVIQEDDNGNEDRESNSSVSVSERSSSLGDNRSKHESDEQNQGDIPTFITEDVSATNETTVSIPFCQLFRIPSNLVESIMFILCRAFLDCYDHWEEEATRRADAVMYSKHYELDQEMDLQIHLHEPRHARIESDIYHVRTAEIVSHTDRVERHMSGVEERLNQISGDYDQILNEFNKSVDAYKNDVNSLEHIFVNATTTGRLILLQDRLKRQRDTFMDYVRVSLRDFRRQFDLKVHHLRQANANFRNSFQTFTEGGNYSPDEIESYRRKLEQTALLIDRTEIGLLKEMERIEKRQLEQANKIMGQFRERFRYHMIDLQFIELTNRWISEAQVKIKTEVGNNNQQANTFKTLVLLYESKIDSIINPNLDKERATINEIRDLFHQIVLNSYERALYLKCLPNELVIPASIISVLKNKGLITEEELVNDLHNTSAIDEGNITRRASRVSGRTGHNNDDTKAVRFTSTSPTLSRLVIGSNSQVGSTGGHQDDSNTFSTIRSLLHKNLEAGSDEIVEPVPTTTESKPRSKKNNSLLNSKKFKQQLKKKSAQQKDSSNDEAGAAVRQGFVRTRTRDELYALYCTFGERKHVGYDFISKILNILRQTTEGLLSHSEMYYKEKGSRRVTRPQALREKFDDFAEIMVEKLKNYEEQCLSHHGYSINEFRNILEVFERASSSMAKMELDEQIIQGEKILFELKQQFDTTFNQNLNESTDEKQKYFELLRPAIGLPAKRSDLETLDNQEKIREDTLEKFINQLRTNTIKDIQTNTQKTIEALATNAERLVILFDEILTADEVIQTRLPKAKQSLLELIRRQRTGRPLEEIESVPLIERKQGHWPGLPLPDDQVNRHGKANVSKKRSSAHSQQQKTTASIVTQKTTLPQIQTISQRDHAYQKYKDNLTKILTDIETKSSTNLTELIRYRSYWNSSLDKLQQLRTN
ncbi:unnamed protein product [Adineta steineri]|uniref:Uncharacterized protein n=1 Tax=Adineta steineri TaxID=433720 RepID=A0A815M0F2_9BILA|nr:unnamed protein product [Adineta steineri]CAF3490348.1 unnamed protein product [Adineta steineri]